MKKDELIATRVSEKDKEIFKKIADEYNLSESALLRMVLSYVLRNDAIKLKKILKQIIDKK